MKEKEFSHYFVNKEHSEKDFFTFSDFCNGVQYTFNSCKGVFSKDSIDYGTKILIETILKKFDKLGDKVLDLCCGYGVIGIILSKRYSDSKFYLSDINKTAIELSNQNVKNNGCFNILQIIESSLFEKIDDTFDFIVTNPPIKSGKSTLFKLADGCYEHLSKNGKLVLVIRKKHGEDSFRKYLISIGFNVEIINREKGYYILEATKL